jgi:type I restriction enzyme S subunit
MNWVKYAQTKDADIQWLDRIPTSWTTRRLGSLYAEIDERRGDRDGLELLSVSIHRGVQLRSDLITDKEARAEDLSGYKVCRAGDIILNRMRAFQGGLGASPRDGIVSPDYMVIRPTADVRSAFLAYLMKTNWFVEQMSSRLRGIGSTDQGNARTPRINPTDLGNIKVPLPPLDVQAEIVEFFDQEAEKIDALIAKQERLIATLRENRTATITHAVTKGLDPHVKFVDSGVAWLSDLPSHWVPARLKNVILSIDSGTSVNGSDSPAGPDEIGVLKTSCVSAGWFNAEANKTVLEEDLSRVTCPVQEERLIVNRANTPLLVGSAGYVSHAPQSLYLSDKLWQVRFRGDLAAFVYYWTQTQVYRSQIAASCVGASSSMQNLSMGDFRNVAIALPPEAEQRSIVRFLSARTTTIDALIAQSNKVIGMIREYRSALITDAVTGKIDVREAA